MGKNRIDGQPSVFAGAWKVQGKCIHRLAVSGISFPCIWVRAAVSMGRKFCDSVRLAMFDRAAVAHIHCCFIADSWRIYSGVCQKCGHRHKFDEFNLAIVVTGLSGRVVPSWLRIDLPGMENRMPLDAIA